MPAHRETTSPGNEPAYSHLHPRQFMATGGLYQKLILNSLNLGHPPRDAKKCHATRVEEDPMVTQNIGCLQRGGGAALIQTNNNNFLNRRGSGGAWAVTTRTG